MKDWSQCSQSCCIVALFTEVMWAFTVLHGSRYDYCINSMR